jgi:hypothetical protein
MSRRTRQSSRVATGTVRERLDHVELAGGGTLLELHVDAVERVPRGPAVQLEEQRVLDAATLTPVRRIGEVPELPPVLGTPEHARRRLRTRS